MGLKDIKMGLNNIITRIVKDGKMSGGVRRALAVRK